MGEINAELKEGISKLIDFQGGKVTKKISEAQKAFIRTQARNGAILGAGLATAGYVLRYVGEHMGWWGGRVPAGTKPNVARIIDATKNPSTSSEGFIKHTEKWMGEHNPWRLKTINVAGETHGPDQIQEVYSDGKLVEKVFPGGIREHYYPDGKLHGIQFPDKTTIVYHDNGPIAEKILPDGHHEYYDQNGNIEKAVDAQGNEIPLDTTPPDHPTPAPKHFPIKTPPVSGTPEALIKIDDIRVVHQGEGIEHALIRQIEHDPKLAQDLGFKGDIGDAKALHTFAGHEAHVLAIKEGFSDGNETWIKGPNKVAFEIKMDDHGHPVITEKTLTGKIIEREEVEKYQSPHAHPGTPKIHTSATPQAQETPASEVISGEQAKALPDNNLGTFEPFESRTPGSIAHENFADNIPPSEHLADTASKIEPEIVQKPLTAEELRAKLEEQMRNFKKSPMDMVKPPKDIPSHDVGQNAPNTPSTETPSGIPKMENLKLPPDYVKNPFSLSPQELIKTANIGQKDIGFVFKGEPSSHWDNLKGLKASTTIKDTKIPIIDTGLKRLVKYMNLLKDYSGLKPKGSGFLRIGGAETNEQFIARAFQKISKDGSVEAFEHDLQIRLGNK